MPKYVQCVLERVRDRTITEQTSFIPAKFAVLDEVLKLRDSTGNWHDGWTVVHVGQTVEKETLDTQWFKRTRRHSDI